MNWNERHSIAPDQRFDGGDLDCGNGLLLLIRKHLDPLRPGEHLEILSTETSVDEDLPAWCRLTHNELVSKVRIGAQRSFLLRKGERVVGTEVPHADSRSKPHSAETQERNITSVNRKVSAPISKIEPFAVMGIGSWPRPRWMLQALHQFAEGKIGETEFHQTADDAVRLAVNAQERANVDLVTDGEQRRDNYASFIGSRLENCQLVPLTDLLMYVDDPATFEKELRSLDVPAELVRHPAILGPLRRNKPLVTHELAFIQTITTKPIKVALPGPYLLTRTMWLECVSEKVYEDREPLSTDLVGILREEIAALLDAGASLVQIDEPILTEVVFGRSRANRSFMCGALGSRKETQEELEFATRLIRSVVSGFPQERLALHVCRGNWSRDESVALAGDYRPLLPWLNQIPVGTFLLEMCTPRAGELSALKGLREDAKLGLGVVNPKCDQVEPLDEIVSKAEQAVNLLGSERINLNPDCGFATFADNPVASAEVAEEKLRRLVTASHLLRDKYAK